MLKHYTVFILILFWSCRQYSTTSDNKVEETNRQFKVLPQAQIPFEKYKINSNEGGVFSNDTDCVMLFPPNAFLNEKGQIVEGEVDISVRMMRTPIDYFLNSVNMRYDSSDTNYWLESKAMFEIIGTHKGKPVRINPESKPEVCLFPTTSGGGIYFSDTIAQHWLLKQATTPYKAQVNAKTIPESLEIKNNIVTGPPIKPVLADPKMPFIEIEVDPTFTELKGFDKLRFQVDELKNKINPRDTSVSWQNIELLKDDVSKQYKIRFSTLRKSVTYFVNPVFEADDFEKAMKKYELEYQNYQQKILETEANKKAKREKFIQDSIRFAESNKLYKMNRLIELRNKEIELIKNNSVEKDAKTIGNQKADLLSSFFQLDGFGTWNIDQPIRKDIISVVASFIDNDNQLVPLQNISVINPKLKTILNFNTSSINLFKNAPNVIVGTHNEQFGYVTAEEIQHQESNKDKIKTFRLKLIPKEQSTYDNIKMLNFQ